MEGNKMGFGLEGLASAVMGAVVAVAEVAIEIAEVANVIAAQADIANILEDGQIDEDEQDRLLDDIHKLVVGAYLVGFGSIKFGSEDCSVSSWDDDSENYIIDFIQPNKVTDGAAVTFNENGYSDPKSVWDCITGLKNYVEDKMSEGVTNIRNEINKESSNIKEIASDTITNFNNEITVLNKGAVVIANAVAAEKSTVKTRISNLWSDFFMPTDLPGELNAAKLIDNPAIEGVAKIGGKLGLVATAINPILEYKNSLKPYEEDLDAVYEIDPENASEYNAAIHVTAGLDALSFGYARGTLNTIPSLYELVEGNAEWADGWINNVNYWVNSRNVMNEIDKKFKDPVTGPKIKQFLR
jgi:hypothetical protein